MIDPSLWYLLPLGFIGALMAMSAGISGSNFWIPLYMIWLGIEPKVGFWLSLLTMLFGFGSGVARNLMQGTVNWPLLRAYLLVCLPAGMLGGLLSPYAPQQLLLASFAAFVLIYGSWMIYSSGHPATASDRTKPAVIVGLIAGFLQGLIATGLGKLMVTRLSAHQQVKNHAEAAGTTVVLVFIVSLAAVLVRLNGAFLEVLAQQRTLILSVMIWIAPGVMIGGQLGPVVSAKIPKPLVKPYVGGLLVLVSALMFYRVFGG